MNKPLWLICQGRSGSTTLLRILNTIDACNICGENMNMVAHLLDFYAHLKETVNQPGYSQSYPGSRRPSWYNVFDFQTTTDDLRRLIVNIFRGLDYRVWGFKEIRFGLDVPYRVFERQIDDIKELFPSIKIVFLYRQDIESQVLSDWWADNVEESRELLLDQLACFALYNDRHRDYTYLLSMEDMLAINGTFIEMFNFIGEAYDKDAIREILSDGKR